MEWEYQDVDVGSRLGNLPNPKDYEFSDIKFTVSHQTQQTPAISTDPHETPTSHSKLAQKRSPSRDLDLKNSSVSIFWWGKGPSPIFYAFYSTSLRLTCYEMEKKSPPQFLKCHWNLHSLHLKMVGRLLSFGVSAYFFRGFLLLVSGFQGRHATKNLRIQPSAPRPSLASSPDLATAEPAQVHGVQHRRILVIPKGEDVWWWWEPRVCWRTPTVDSTSTDWKEPRKKHKKRRKKIISSHFSQGTSWFFFTWSKICIKPSHAPSWDKTTSDSLGKKCKKFKLFSKTSWESSCDTRLAPRMTGQCYRVPLWATTSSGENGAKKSRSRV